MWLGEFEKALVDSDLALRLDPSDAALHHSRCAVLLGMCKRGDDRIDEARNFARGILKLNPNDVGAKLNLRLLDTIEKERLRGAPDPVAHEIDTVAAERALAMGAALMAAEEAEKAARDKKGKGEAKKSKQADAA